MAYDGIVINSIIKEIRDLCLGGRCVKLQQPEPDTITLTMKGFKGQTRIYISANASLPIVYIADTLPNAPMQAPAFCMLLRKHISGGRLVRLEQPGFDRVFDFVFEHMDEMGDISERHLIVEIMGRQSNVILTDSDMMILDCLKRIMPDLDKALEKDDDSSVRILYPGKQYLPPDSQGKLNPLTGFNKDVYENVFLSKNGPVVKALFGTFTGFSKLAAEEIVFRSNVESRKTVQELTDPEKEKLFEEISRCIEDIKAESFSPCIAYVDGVPKDYHAFSLTMYGVRSDAEERTETGGVGDTETGEASMSKLLVNFYNTKQQTINVRSKSQDIRKILNLAVERTARKLDLQRNQLKDTEDRDKYRIYGELLNTYGYDLKGGEESLTCLNYYDNKEITIPLDKDLDVRSNSNKYFSIYNKKKRTAEVLTDFVEKTDAELQYLLSAKHSLEIAENESDIEEIRKELIESGVLKKMKRSKGDRRTAAGEPLHFVSSDGYDIYVGKNNIQNDKLTFGLATGRDLWFHIKKAPGSHVIVKLKPEDEGLDSVPDRVFEEAAGIAAYFSSMREAPKVEIDYTERKNLKKPPGANPGYVIYHTNYSMMATPELPQG